MISRCTSNIPKEDVVFPRLHYSNSRCSQACCSHSQVQPGMSLALPDMSSAYPDLLWALPGLFLVLQGASTSVVSPPRLITHGPRCSQVHVMFCPALWRVFKHITTTLMVLLYLSTFDPSYSKGWPECPPRVWYSLDIDTSKCTLQILFDTSGGHVWLKYILLKI